MVFYMMNIKSRHRVELTFICNWPYKQGEDRYDKILDFFKFSLHTFPNFSQNESQNFLKFYSYTVIIQQGSWALETPFALYEVSFAKYKQEWQ